MKPRGALQLECRTDRFDYQVTGGGFACEHGHLTVSLEAMPVDKESWPPVAMFCLEGVPLPPGPLSQGAGFDCDFSARKHEWASAQLPKVHAYLTFHALDVAVHLVVMSVKPAEVEFRFDATTDDPNFYDERARPARWRGGFWLPCRSREELWVPS